MALERKVCYLLYDKKSNNFELYINTQKYNPKFEDWEFKDKLDENLAYIYSLFKREGDKEQEGSYIHQSVLYRITLFIEKGYRFLGIVAEVR